MGFNPAKSALVLIDVQKAFLEWEAGGLQRNNLDAVANIAQLVKSFRAQEMPIFHVRHSSTEEGSALRPEQSGFEPMDEAKEIEGEPVFIKHVNSGFIGTDLEETLRTAGISTLMIAGITTNHCVETTTRMAGNLGFDARLIEDACYTFARTGWDGHEQSAEEIHHMSLSNLNGEFATIETTKDICAALTSPAAA